MPFGRKEQKWWTHLHNSSARVTSERLSSQKAELCCSADSLVKQGECWGLTSMHFPSASQSMPHANIWKEAKTRRVHYHLSSPSVERIKFYCGGSQLALITHSSENEMEGWAVFQSGLIPLAWKQKQLSAVRGEVSAGTVWRRSAFLEIWVASVSSPEFGFQALTFTVRILPRIHSYPRNDAEAKLAPSQRQKMLLIMCPHFPLVYHGRIFLVCSKSKSDSAWKNWKSKQTNSKQKLNSAKLLNTSWTWNFSTRVCLSEAADVLLKQLYFILNLAAICWIMPKVHQKTNHIWLEDVFFSLCFISWTKYRRSVPELIVGSNYKSKNPAFYLKMNRSCTDDVLLSSFRISKSGQNEDLISIYLLHHHSNRRQ